jgi:hypothetical protein
MKRNKLIYSAVVLAFGCMALTSCNSYLDEMPDNRTTIDSEDKVKNLLVSAYFTQDYNVFTEYLSDNVDEYLNSNTGKFIDEIYKWQDPTQTNNESPESFWQTAYSCIVAANTALEGIDKLGATTTTLKECKAEALMARAYAHFMLVNIFSMNYNSATSSKDLGIPYQYATGSTIGVVPDRGTVAQVYENIDKDIQEAIPLLGDTHLTVPKYHFNMKAAYAFACRFYLYYEKWDEAIKYANLCLGSSPKSMLRDWKYESTEIASQIQPRAQHYVSSELNCNLLLTTGYSAAGLCFGNYSTWKKYAHGPYLDVHETSRAANIWGSAALYDGTKIYAGTGFSYNIFWRVPYLFQYTDAVAGIGYYKSIFPVLTTDECLLNRAEAYIMTKQYDLAAADLTMWMQNFTKSTMTLTPDNIKTFYNAASYSYDDVTGLEGTIKKHLHPAFTIDAEGSTQETMLQCVLGFRRLETMPWGLRWFDIKRYGIEIVRRKMDLGGNPVEKTDFLSKDDPRRALQLPSKVLDAGVAANPRK